MSEESRIDLEEESAVDSKAELEEPRMFRVILHNDHYTTMDFVVELLTGVFHKPGAEATRIMLDVHKKGIGIVGVYPLDIAATKVAQVDILAKQRQFPLKCSYEEV